MTDPNIPAHNQAPEPERASHQQYVEAFDAIELEVQTSGAVEYRAPVEQVGEEWIDGKRIQHVKTQANIDLEMVSATDILERVSEGKQEILWSLGITPDKAERQVVNLSFAPECHLKDSEGNVRYQPGSAIVLVTTEDSSGGFEVANYEVKLDRSDGQELTMGLFSKGLELGQEDVLVPVKDAETLEVEDVDVTDLAMQAILKGYEAKDEKGRDENFGFDPALMGEDVEGTRDYLTSAEAEAMKLIAQHYSS